MSRRLANKIAIITGSSSGIGRATALAFAREGANIVCSDICEASPEAASQTPSTSQQVAQLGAKSIFVKCDTRLEDDIQALVAKTVSHFGRVDIMVNNAGIAGAIGPVWEQTAANWDEVLSINLRGVFLGTKHAVLQMKEQAAAPASGDRGSVINIASVLGLNGSEGTAAYAASKHGVLGLTKTAALDCAPLRIHVNAICPGYTNTPLIAQALERDGAADVLRAVHPFRGLGMPEDIAKAAVFLASDDSSWVTGTSIVVDGGYNCK